MSGVGLGRERSWWCPEQPVPTGAAAVPWLSAPVSGNCLEREQHLILLLSWLTAALGFLSAPPLWVSVLQ